MPDDEVHLHVRMPATMRDTIDELAVAMAENRSEWVLRVLRAEIRRLRGMRPGRTVRVEVGGQPKMRASPPQHLCSHPAQLRSDPHPKTAETRCMACGAVVRPLR